MFAKLTRLAVSSTILFAAAGNVGAQQDAPPRAPWPFGNALGNIFGTTPTGPNANSAMQSNGGMTNQQTAPMIGNGNDSMTHSVTSQSETNRRLYGPSLAIRGGVADG